MLKLNTYAGLIRNWKELAKELSVNVENLDHTARERTIITAAYEKWGKDVGNHINGQFAFAIYDTEAEELFCARDILGAELFFYYETADGNFLFATEIKELFDQPGFVREINEQMIQFYLGFTYLPGEETLFKGVYKLEPGGYATFNKRDGLTLGKYWELNFEPDESKSLDEWADEIENAFKESLECVCDEQDTPDTFLSGGVDSSYILAASRAKTGYCASYANQDISEEEQAKETAAHFGRGFEGVQVTAQDFLATIDEFLLAYEIPTADIAGLSLYCAAKKVKEKSSLCFSGEGADEFFAGYSVYAPQSKIRKMLNPIYYGTTYIMNEREQSRFLQRYDNTRSTSSFIEQRCAPGKVYDELGQKLYTDLRTYFEGSILYNSTKISRGTGLDIRMPYCDLRIFDIARRLPSRYKTTAEGNKIALRAAASRILPHEVAYRKKLGFPVPAREWLKMPEFLSEISRAFESNAAKKFFREEELQALLSAFKGESPKLHAVWFKRRTANLWRYVWTLYTFIRWYELFFEQQ